MKSFTHRSTFRLTLLVGALACLTTFADTSTDTTGYTSLNTNANQAVEFDFADLVKPFDPPALEEIVSGNEWTDKPVLDAVELMRERQEGEQATRLTSGDQTRNT